jgi:hypothetical protein
VYRRSLVRRTSIEDKSSIEDAARRDSAVHVSLSSYSPVKQPGTVAVPLPGGPESRRSLKPPTEIGSLVTIVVRSFEGAQSHRKADGAPYAGI